MAIYTWRGTEYLVTRDWMGTDLHIPMNIVTDAIVRAADEGSDAYQIEAYIRDAVTLFGETNAEAIGIPSPEAFSLENADSSGPLEIVINGETYRFNAAQYETLSDLAVWIVETLNQAVERLTADYIARLEADLEKTGLNNITLKIKI
ncbi:hypothetical protein C6503_06170 [Candidatus Poribacteria bacterium]|nr:MAG: hypothetical protein C6503_06170 [Candidatus Poribacteria bacterium]